MNALFTLQCEIDPSLKLLKYSEFASDPLGHQAKLRAIELSKKKVFDQFTNSIQLSQIQGKKMDYQKHLSEVLNDPIYLKGELDKYIDTVGSLEDKI
jgi:hypothetical protein